MTANTVLTFSLAQVQVASANGDGTFGTAKTFYSAKTLTATKKVVADKAYGNNKITGLAAMTISYDVALDSAGFDDDVLNILLGLTSSSSGSGTNTDEAGSVLNPYFGLIAVTNPTTGDYLLFFPNCKVTGDIGYKLDFGKFSVPSLKMEAIHDDTLGYILRRRKRTVVGAITFPLSA